MPGPLKFLTVGLLALVWPAFDLARHHRQGFLRH